MWINLFHPHATGMEGKTITGCAAVGAQHFRNLGFHCRVRTGYE
ncbi:hypothetical protein MPS_3329 [Mycobacterium pseudoshottsii JCM 15466]|nr:hypothetical protein MPS_3329 [Mycobacterium pseudoshottsii JCM 15466]